MYEMVVVVVVVVVVLLKLLYLKRTYCYHPLTASLRSRLYRLHTFAEYCRHSAAKRSTEEWGLFVVVASGGPCDPLTC